MVRIGTNESGQPVALSAAGRRQGTYILGINGTGKSNLILNIALQDIEAGDGLCLMDPHGDLIEDVLQRIPEHRLGDVILFDPADVEYPFGLNMFELEDATNPRLVDRVCSEVVLTFKKAWADSWGPRMEDLLRNAILAIMATPDRSMLDMLLLLTDQVQRERYVARISDPVVRHYWQQTFPKGESRQAEWTSPVLNKLGRFLTNPLIRNIACQAQSSFDFRAVMDEGKVLLVNLSRGQLGDDNSTLLGSTLIGKFLIAALSRADIPVQQRRHFHLIVDEYQNFATDSFPTLQSEARKFAIDTIVAHQYRDQLDLLNKGSTLNVGNFILFRVSGLDAKQMALQFDNCPPEPEPVLRPIPTRTGQEGIFRNSTNRVLVRGNSRSYGDVENETANQLANAPNYHAHCKFIENGELVEHYILSDRVGSKADECRAEEIRMLSRKLAMPRSEIEARIAAVWGEPSDGYTMD